MATVTTRPMTAEEFEAFASRPENADRFLELDEGEVIEVPPPKFVHAAVSLTLGEILWGYCRSRGRGFVFSDAGILVSRESATVRAPDLMVYADLSTFGEVESRPGYVETPPTLAVEILSPTDRHGQIARKVTQYLAAGVGIVWVIDLPAREVTIYRAGVDPDVVAADGVLDGGDLLPGLSVPVADLFRGPAEK